MIVLLPGSNDGSQEDAVAGGLQPPGGADEGGASLGLVLAPDRQSLPPDLGLRLPGLPPAFLSGREVRLEPDHRRQSQGLSVRRRQLVPELQQRALGENSRRHHSSESGILRL